MRFLVAALFLAFSATASAAPPDRSDHPLISAYEGSSARKKTVMDFDVYRAFIGIEAATKKPGGLDLEGKVTRLFYKNPAKRSVLEIFRNYENALKAAGGETVYQCDQAKGGCVARYAQRTLNDFNGLSAISNSDGRYILAKVTKDAHTAYVAVAVGPGFTQIDVVEVKAMDMGKVAVDAAALGNALTEKGYVTVEGIFFDTDKATLKPSSKAALDEVAKLLKSRPALNVFVVGHTDMKGSFAHNMKLSQDRSRAVATTLVNDYGLAADRLEGHGVGPLAPQASNTGGGGRAMNRRVVLVAR